MTRVHGPRHLRHRRRYHALPPGDSQALTFSAAQGEWIGLAVPAVAGALAAGLAGVAWMIFAE